MNSEEVVALLPKLTKAALRIVCNGCLVEDLIQEGAMKLLTTEVTTCPLHIAGNAMKDYCRTNGYHPRNTTGNGLKRSSAKYLIPLLLKEEKDYDLDLEGVYLTEEEREVIRLHCELGQSFAEIARHYGKTDHWVIDRVKKAAIKAARAWGMLENK